MAPNTGHSRKPGEQILEPILNLVSLLPERLLSQAESDGQIASLRSDIQSHISTIRTCGATLLTGDNIDKAPELDGKVIALWNLTTRLKRQWGSEENVAAAAATNSSKANSRASLVPLIRVFTFNLLDCIARSHKHANANASARRPAAEPWKDSIRLLRTALKTSKSCMEHLQLDYSAKILERAAEHQDALEKLADRKTKDGKEQQATEADEDKAGLCRMLKMEYLGLRMTLAWKQGNLDVVEMMFNQAAETAKAAEGSATEQLADLSFEIGRDLFGKKDFYRAANWLERANVVLQGARAENLSADAEELRVSIAHSLVRAYIGLDTDVARGKASDLLTWMEHEFSNRKVVLILRLDLVLAIEPFDSESFFNALSQLIRTLHMTEPNFTLLKSYIRRLKDHDPELACKALDDLLTLRLLEHAKVEWIQKSLVTRLWMTPATNAEASNQLMSSIHTRMNRQLTNKATHAAQTLLWKHIDACTKAGDWVGAESWSRTMMHPLLSNTGHLNSAKIARRIMSCALARGDTATARTTFNQMPEAARNEALTRYIAYKIALRDKDEELAADCFEMIANNSSQDPKLLYGCVLEAQQSGNRPEAIRALQAVLAKCSTGGLSDVHLPSLLRCTLRLQTSELSVSPSSDAVDAVCVSFRAATATMIQQPKAFDERELDWLVANSYNLALKNYTEWSSQATLDLLEACVSFSNHRPMFSGPNDQPATVVHLMACHSLAAQACLKLARNEEQHNAQLARYHDLRKHVQNFYQIWERPKGNLSPTTFDDASMQRILRRLLISDFESVIRLKLWDELPNVVRRCQHIGDLKIYQTLADMILPSDASSQVIIDTLQHIISSSAVSHQPLPMQARARWFRILYQLSVKPSATSTPSDAFTTNALLEQILMLLRSSPPTHDRDDKYPSEEIEYLATVTYNRAIDAYCAGRENEFRKLAALAGEFSGFMDDGGALKGMIKGKVEQLLDGAGSDGEEGEENEEGNDEDNAGIAGLGGEEDADVL